MRESRRDTGRERYREIGGDMQRGEIEENVLRVCLDQWVCGWSPCDFKTREAGGWCGRGGER